MKVSTLFLAMTATPAFAHHEVVVATSMLPLIGGMATIAVAALAAMRKLRRELHASPKKDRSSPSS
jgi:hypothetical protein